MSADITERVHRLVAATAPRPRQPADLTAEQRLIEDLGYDSLRLMELTVILERAFDLPRYLPEELVGVRAVGDVVALVERTTGTTT